MQHKGTVSKESISISPGFLDELALGHAYSFYYPTEIVSGLTKARHKTIIQKYLPVFSAVPPGHLAPQTDS